MTANEFCYEHSWLHPSVKKYFLVSDDLKTTSNCFSPEKALALLLDAKLSKYQYEMLKKACRNIGHDIFPCYSKVLEAKKTCYPENININESSATVPLQSILDHTASRILKGQNEQNIIDLPENLTLISKWGCDGSSGHNEYKQVFIENDRSDSNLFLTSLVPLGLHDSNNINNEFWVNPKPSSTRLCRPIKFEYIKETPESTKKEVDRVNDEIRNLKGTIVNINQKICEIHHVLLFTMIDGKIAQTITETSSMAVCCICKAKPSEMNNIERCLNKKMNTDAYKFGLHPLHARIKFMECILHIAYNQNFRSWRINGNETKAQKEETKKIIQEKFKNQLGIKVDFVKQGMGTSNDGNTSRRFFANPQLTSEITGVNESLITRFAKILNDINSKDSIDAEEFGDYCLETAKLYIELYDWYYMPNSVHKILIHGRDIVKAAMLPIGKLTEEAQEARNKDYRKYRLDHSRKCSRLATNEDIFNMLCASSDPYIYTFRTEPNYN